MSRTDAHVPVPVRIARGELGALARHDHRTTVCDLPPRAHIERRWRRSGDTDCFWDWTWIGVADCSCEMCHAGGEKRRERRRDRQAARRRLARVAAGHRVNT